MSLSPDANPWQRLLKALSPGKFLQWFSHTSKMPPVIQAIRADDMEKLASLLNDPQKPADPNTKYNDLPALEWAQYNVEATKLLLDKGANPFSLHPFFKTTQRERLEGDLEIHNAKAFWSMDTPVRAAEIVELLKVAEANWLKTHPGADTPYTGSDRIPPLTANSFPYLPFRSDAVRPAGP